MQNRRIKLCNNIVEFYIIKMYWKIREVILSWNPNLMNKEIPYLRINFRDQTIPIDEIMTCHNDNTLSRSLEGANCK